MLRGIALQPGDILLYQGRSLMSWLIRIKTFSPISHVEMVAFEGFSYASRDGIGVGTFPFREDGLYAILRLAVPLTDFELEALDRAQKAYDGLPYDWLGLFGFFGPSHGIDGQSKAFCSEHIARLFKLAGRPLFGVAYPSDKVSPGMFLACPLLDVVWQDLDL
jgi:hypothetical protein